MKFQDYVVQDKSHNAKKTFIIKWQGNNNDFGEREYTAETEDEAIDKFYEDSLTQVHDKVVSVEEK